MTRVTYSVGAMTSKLETTIKIDNWDEKPTAEYDDGTKVAHAVVTPDRRATTG